MPIKGGGVMFGVVDLEIIDGIAHGYLVIVTPADLRYSIFGALTGTIMGGASTGPWPRLRKSRRRSDGVLFG